VYLISSFCLFIFFIADTDRKKFARARDERTEDSQPSQGTSDRPRFPYPETRSRRESPYDKPAPSSPPPSTSRPKPRPAYTGSSSRAKPSALASASAPNPSADTTGAGYLATISTRRNLVEEILKKFPHPVTDRQLLWETIADCPSNRRLWHTVVLVSRHTTLDSAS
jgi:hypothetical protein